MRGIGVFLFCAVVIDAGRCYPADGIGPITTLEALYLAFTQLQQAGSFAYAQPPARCILNHFHALELFLTHRHHPYRVTKSRCSYGVTLSWSIYTGTIIGSLFQSKN